MRSQWCREHIDETAENCGLEDRTVSDVKRAAKFCAANGNFSPCSTKAIIALISIKDDPVRNRAISLAEKVLKEETPTGGKKREKLTEHEIKKIVDQSFKELHTEPPKKPPYNGTPQKPAVKESLTVPPSAPIAQTLKEKYGGNELPASIKKSLTLEPDGSEGFASTPLPPITDITGQVSPPADTPPIPFSTKAPCLSGQPCPDASGRSYIKTEVQRGKVCELWNLPLNQLPGGECPILLRQKKAQEGGFVPAGDIDSITGGKIVRGPPVRITKAPMTVHFEPSPKQANFIHEAIESGKFDTPEQVISQALDLWMDQEGV